MPYMVEGENRPSRPDQGGVGKKPENPPVSETPKTTKRPSYLKVAGDLFANFVMEHYESEVQSSLGMEEEHLSTRQVINKKVNKKLGTTLSKPFMPILVGPILRRIESKWMPKITPEFQENFKDFREALNKRMKNPKAVAVTISNHFDHGNGVEMMFMSKMVLDAINSDRAPENYVKHTRLVIAKSLKNGLQEAFLQSIIERAEKNYLSKYYLSTLASVTKNDQKRRHMDMAGNVGFMKELIRIAKTKNEMLEIFVEGTIDGGRFTDGKRNGMQPLITELDQIFNILKANDSEIVFIPFGTQGKNRIHTDSKLPTRIALKTLFIEKNPKSLVDIKVGMPITYTEIKQQILEQKGKEATPDDIRDYLGRTCIAPLIPPDFQGVFREK